MTPSVAHFSDESWADFVHAVLPAAERAKMQNHLDSGCVECNETARLFAKVAEAAEFLRLEVPESLTSAAVAVFQHEAKDRDWIEKLRPLVPSLVFGPGLDWEPVGVRGATLEGNRAVYHAGEYAVDLSSEMPELPGRPDIVGQISHQQDAGRDLGEVIVQVLAGGRTVSETAANRFGEFVIELPLRNYAILRFAMKQQGHRIDLPLKMPVSRWRLPS